MSKPSATKQVPPAAQNQSIAENPLCKNKKQAKLVCLNPDCQEHAFFCTSCENQECEVIHQHGNKLLSVSFKEYIKRVLKDKRIDDQLEEALNRYSECLQKLKKDVEQFVQKQIKQIEQIRKKANELGEEEEKVIQKLRKKQYNGLKGAELDNLWQKVIEVQKNEKNKDTIQFLAIKQEQIKQISDNFEKVNKMELEDYMQEENESERQKKTEKQKTQKSESKMSNNQKQGQGKGQDSVKKQEAQQNKSTIKSTTSKR